VQNNKQQLSLCKDITTVGIGAFRIQEVVVYFEYIAMNIDWLVDRKCMLPVRKLLHSVIPQRFSFDGPFSAWSDCGKEEPLNRNLAYICVHYQDDTLLVDNMLYYFCVITSINCH